MATITDVLKALSDETRLRIINLLYEQELCVCDLMETLQIPQAKASRHLGCLKNAGLVKDRKQAQWAYYFLSKEEKVNFIDSLVHENLRAMEPYKNDLMMLKASLSGPCDQCK